VDGGSRRVTIVDVARHANVSTTAVSKVLRNAYGASAAMREKVQQAIDELGYRPYAAARGLRGQTYTVGVLLPDLRNPFFPDILDGITATLRQSGYHVLLSPGCDNEQDETTITNSMIDHGMDGLVLIAPVAPRSHLEHLAATVPTVVIGRHGHSPHYDTVTDDDIAGAALVVNHLADLGHRHIAHIEHHETEAGLSVPGDMSVAGYDNTSVAALAPISLTSVDQGGHHIGTNAARLLLDRIADRSRPTAQVKLSPTLVTRRTTGPVT
jgi:LacI family transcriptional regulator